MTSVRGGGGCGRAIWGKTDVMAPWVVVCRRMLIYSDMPHHRVMSFHDPQLLRHIRYLNNLNGKEVGGRVDDL